jgi:hypothetical protein
MDTSSFDPTRAVVFDLNRGQVTLNGGAAVLVIPAEILAQVCAGLDVAAVRQFGSMLGKHAGGRVRARLSAGFVPTLEVMVDHLGGEMSLAGLGSLVMERWGQALVVRIESCPLAQGQELMSAYIEAALLAAVGREVTALVLERGASSIRLLLCSKAASTKVKGWLAGGASWADALAALHQSAKNGALGGRG